MRLLTPTIRAGIVLLMALTIAACGTDNPPSGSDWCFRFYFTNSPYTVNITDGLWVEGVGIQPDEIGHLTMSYSQTLIVVPTIVILTLSRGEGVEGPIDVAANAQIFGVTTGGPISNTIPGDLDSFNLRLTPANVGDGSANFNISATASDTMQLEAMTIAGQGASPFTTDNCEGEPTPIPTEPLPTSTGTLATPTPSDTPTPTETFTPTNTYTPSMTPTASPWCQFWDFSTDGEILFGTRVSGGIQQVNTSGSNYYAAAYVDIPENIVITWAQTYATDEGASDSFTVRALDALDNEVEVLWDDTSGNGYTWDSFSWDVNALEVIRLLITVQHAVGSHVRTMESFEACGYYIIPPTPTPTNTLNLTWTQTASPTRTLTPNPLITGTPPTATITRTATSTNIPIYTLPPVATLPPPIATGTSIKTSTPFGTPAGTPGGTSTPWTPQPITGTPMDGEPWATSQGPGIGPPGDGPGDDGPSGCDGSGAISLMCNVINTSTNAMNQAFGYIGELNGRMVAFVTAYQNATPTAIPGLPHCATDRFGSELCAIYYILTYTVLSGPIGSLIVPVAVIDIDILILFTFVKLVRALLVRLAGVLQQ